MNITEYLMYFEDLATKHKLVAHTSDKKAFFANDIPEVLVGLKIDNPKNPFVIINNYNGTITENKGQSRFYTKECAFLVLQHAPVGDWEKQKQVKATTERISFDFISKMLADKNDTQNPCNKMLLSLSNISIKGIYAILDNCFGWIVEFDLNHRIDLDYKPNNWM